MWTLQVPSFITTAKIRCVLRILRPPSPYANSRRMIPSSSLISIPLLPT